jgi:uncharacterized protein (DUF427 family)
MVKAMWNGKVIAESDKTEVVEANHYFPPNSVNMEFLKKNGEQYTCTWKGTCDYYDVTVGGETNEGAAFVYPTPSEAAKKIAGYFAFWKGVEIKE